MKKQATKKQLPKTKPIKVLHEKQNKIDILKNNIEIQKEIFDKTIPNDGSIIIVLKENYWNVAMSNSINVTTLFDLSFSLMRNVNYKNKTTKTKNK